MDTLITVCKIAGVVLLADFLSGFFHWLEDSYGREDFPITGRLYTKPNIRHHHEPRYFVRHNWFQCSWDLALLSFIIVLVAWSLQALTWEVWLFAVLAANANEFHKWAHRTRKENGPWISLLHDLRLIQGPKHHAHHHTDPKSSHYCVITNFLNPVLEALGFWRALEWIILRFLGLRKRPDPSVCCLQDDDDCAGEPLRSSDHAAPAIR